MFACGYLFVCLSIFFFETGSHYVALADLELNMQSTLTPNYGKVPASCFPRTRITHVNHHAWLPRAISLLKGGTSGYQWLLPFLPLPPTTHTSNNHM